MNLYCKHYSQLLRSVAAGLRKLQLPFCKMQVLYYSYTDLFGLIRKKFLGNVIREAHVLIFQRALETICFGSNVDI
jgi:hypothetical protein